MHLCTVISGVPVEYILVHFDFFAEAGGRCPNCAAEFNGHTIVFEYLRLVSFCFESERI